MASKSTASSASSRDLIVAFLHKHLAGCDSEFAEHNDTFLERGSRVLVLKSFLAKSATIEANHCYRKSALQTDLDTVRAQRKASQSSVAMATCKLDTPRAKNRHLASQISD